MKQFSLSWTALKALATARGIPIRGYAIAGGKVEAYAFDVDAMWTSILTSGSDITEFNGLVNNNQRFKAGLWDSNGNRLTIDSAGAAKTYVALPIPNPTLVAVTQTQRVGARGAAENFRYVIPSGKKLSLLSFQAGSEVGAKGARVALYYAPSGSLNGSEVILGNAYCNGTNFSTALSDSYTGNGTAAIILELDNLGGGTLEVFGRWTGERDP